MKLILASSSPRRAEVLRNAEIEFELRSALVGESRNAGESPSEYVQRLALAKARAVGYMLGDARENILIVGADTVVLIGDEILGKPESADDARRMLRRLSGTVHEVHTGLAVLSAASGAERVVEEISLVHFAPLTEAEIDAYLATGEPFDKAGAYGIQGIGGRYVTRVEGCYFNVMGMPLARLWSLLREFGWDRPASQVADA
jgi:septum formation protein